MRQKKTAALHQQLRKIDPAENAHAREIEQVAHPKKPPGRAARPGGRRARPAS